MHIVAPAAVHEHEVFTMPDRTRPIRKEICLSEQELHLIQHKIRRLGTHNFGA